MITQSIVRISTQPINASHPYRDRSDWFDAVFSLICDAMLLPSEIVKPQVTEAMLNWESGQSFEFQFTVDTRKIPSSEDWERFTTDMYKEWLIVDSISENPTPILRVEVGDILPDVSRSRLVRFFNPISCAFFTDVKIAINKAKKGTSIALPVTESFHEMDINWLVRQALIRGMVISRIALDQSLLYDNTQPQTNEEEKDMESKPTMKIVGELISDDKKQLIAEFLCTLTDCGYIETKKMVKKALSSENSKKVFDFTPRESIRKEAATDGELEVDSIISPLARRGFRVTSIIMNGVELCACANQVTAYLTFTKTDIDPDAIRGFLVPTINVIQEYSFPMIPLNQAKPKAEFILEGQNENQTISLPMNEDTDPYSVISAFMGIGLRVERMTFNGELFLNPVKPDEDEPLPENPEDEESDTPPQYVVQVFVKHGIYQYPVPSAEKAVAHAEAIMSNQTYRRAIPGGMEVHPVYKVKALGPGLESQYHDTFIRT